MIPHGDTFYAVLTDVSVYKTQTLSNARAAASIFSLHVWEIGNKQESERISPLKIIRAVHFDFWEAVSVTISYRKVEYLCLTSHNTVN